jgi:hypothetical protein
LDTDFRGFVRMTRHSENGLDLDAAEGRARDTAMSETSSPTRVEAGVAHLSEIAAGCVPAGSEQKNRHLERWPTRKSRGGECERSGRHYFFPGSLFLRPRGLLSGRLNLISFFETSCSFSRRPFHHPARALGDVAPSWLAENDDILPNGDRPLSTSR